MDQYASSLARICLELGGISVFYENNVPEDFVIPSLYFPSAEQVPSGSALNSYQLKHSIYAKVFALTRREAGELAGKIVEGIMDKQCRSSQNGVLGTARERDSAHHDPKRRRRV